MCLHPSSGSTRKILSADPDIVYHYLQSAQGLLLLSCVSGSYVRSMDQVQRDCGVENRYDRHRTAGGLSMLFLCRFLGAKQIQVPAVWIADLFWKHLVLLVVDQ